MHTFSRLCIHLQLAAVNQRERILSDYVFSVEEEHLAQSFHLLLGNRPERCMNAATLRKWVLQESGIPEWLLEESIDSIGDASAALAMVISNAPEEDPISLPQVMHLLEELKNAPAEEQQVIVAEVWKRMDAEQRLVFNKLLTGSFKYSIRPVEAAKAIAHITSKPLAELILAFSQKWKLQEWSTIIEQASDSSSTSSYLPFRPVSESITEVETLGQHSEWVAQWSYQGIHVQARVLKKGIQLWTRNEELLPDVFPEVRNAASHFEEGTLLIAELMLQASDDKTPGYFPNLIKRIQSKTSRHDLMVRSPAQLLVQDMLFDGTRDLRALPFIERNKRLAAKMKDIDDYGFLYSSAIDFSTWEELKTHQASIRASLADGISLQKGNAPWNTHPLVKLKAAPFELNAVLLYVSKIPDKNKKIITECGFGIWREGPASPQELISITRSSEGLSADEIKELDAWVKAHTRERFGPVKSVEAERVFQLQFDDIQPSRRHKSGLVLHNVRMKIPREPLSIQQAGTLLQLNALVTDSN